MEDVCCRGSRSSPLHIFPGGGRENGCRVFDGGVGAAAGFGWVGGGGVLWGGRLGDVAAGGGGLGVLCRADGVAGGGGVAGVRGALCRGPTLTPALIRFAAQARRAGEGAFGWHGF